jgi:hypothetical protein
MGLLDMIESDDWQDATRESLDYRRRVCVRDQVQYEFEPGESHERLCPDCAEVQCHGCDEGTRVDGSEYCIDCRREVAIYQEMKRLRML